MTRKLLHVGINVASPSRVKHYERIFNKAKDWFRYAPNCYILWTTLPAARWARRLRKIVKDKESFLVCELNFKNHQGWLTSESWKWINTKAFPTPPKEVREKSKERSA